VYGKESHQKEDFKEPPPYSWEKILFRNMIHCSGMFRKTDCEKAGYYDAEMLYGYEDWEFWLRLLAVTGKAVRVTDALLYVRSKTVSRTANMCSYRVALMRRKIYTKHASWYEPFFNDPIDLYNQLYVFEASFKAVQKRPFYFALSRLFKKVKKGAHSH